MSQFKCVDITNPTTVRNFSSSALKYNIITQGINLWAKCQNCQNYVNIQIGLSSQKSDSIIRMGELDSFTCPNNACREEIDFDDIINIMFYDCVVKFEAMLVGKGKYQLVQKQDNKSYKQFESDQTKNYRCLNIKTIPYTTNKQDIQDLKNTKLINC